MLDLEIGNTVIKLKADAVNTDSTRSSEWGHKIPPVG
jgi:hypothetical protein